eukprot:12892760-Alexandrium_andersonii.AAC.1
MPACPTAEPLALPVAAAMAVGCACCRPTGPPGRAARTAEPHTCSIHCQSHLMRPTPWCQARLRWGSW